MRHHILVDVSLRAASAVQERNSENGFVAVMVNETPTKQSGRSPPGDDRTPRISAAFIAHSSCGRGFAMLPLAGDRWRRYKPREL
jgi:hypothetical protein